MSDPIGSMGEDRLIETVLRMVPQGEGAAGPGDDCAVIERDGVLQLLKTDAMVEGVHWAAETEPQRVGWKAAARVISDMAAMGGRAEEFLITIAMPANTTIDWVTGLYEGIGKCLTTHGGVVVGGETSSSPDGAPIVISISASGSVARDQVVMRSTARPGDALLVTGTLGGSLKGKHLDFTPRLAAAHWLTTHFKPSAMMDLSDGLAKDLPRLARASACGFKLQSDAIPRTAGCDIANALNDGEDYELLLSIEAGQVPALLEAWSQEFPDLALSVIGNLCVNSEGDQLEGGWDHFR